MKKALFSVIIVLPIIIFPTSSCKKEQLYLNDAIITGFDARMCACCGGLMITFNGETRPYMGEFRLIENVTALGITDNDNFPIYVKVNWRTDTTSVCNHILLTSITRR
ncbi:MAG: hypothetical protein ABI760_21420 [Ferruginibacter sp.]